VLAERTPEGNIVDIESIQSESQSTVAKSDVVESWNSAAAKAFSTGLLYPSAVSVGVSTTFVAPSAGLLISGAIGRDIQI